MKPVMYLFLNRGLGMSKGKSSAQVAHAACKALRISKPSVTADWDLGQHETKLVLLGEDEQHMLNVERYINDRGYATALVIDEGRTEIKPHSITALGVEILDKSDPNVLACFESFKAYKDEAIKKKKRKFFGTKR